MWPELVCEEYTGHWPYGVVFRAYSSCIFGVVFSFNTCARFSVLWASLCEIFFGFKVPGHLLVRKISLKYETHQSAIVSRANRLLAATHFLVVVLLPFLGWNVQCRLHHTVWSFAFGFAFASTERYASLVEHRLVKTCNIYVWSVFATIA